MVEIIDKKDCCGCQACMQACPKHCISFNEDGEGFSYPIVNTDLCIACGLCEKVCPFLGKYEERVPLKILASKNHDEDIKLHSSSGGVFYELAKSVIEDEDGVVFGAVFDKQWEVHHVCATSMKDVLSMMGSKYVQSQIENSYIEVRKFLREGKTVLFSGCPCQVAGLHSFLRNKDYENLITIDFLCHGVPSPGVWRKYLKTVSRNRGLANLWKKIIHKDVPASISSVSFREKSLGWRKYCLSIQKTVFPDREEILLKELHRENVYMKGFLNDLYLRPSCYECKFKRFQSQSDMTLADFWGIYKSHPEFDDNEGISMLFFNTEKGKDLYNKINHNFDSIETSFEDCLSNNGLSLKVHVHKMRKYFYEHFHDSSNILSLIEYCIEGSYLNRIFRKIKNKIS